MHLPEKQMDNLNQERFKQLFERYTSGKCTEEERNEFFDLYAQHKDDEALQSLLDELYRQVKAETPAGAFVNFRGDISLPEIPGTRTRKVTPVRKLLIRTAAAAAIIGVAAAAWLLTQHRQSAPSLALNADTGKVSVIAATTTIHTANNEKKVIVLSDSTRITLNAATEIRYPDTFDQRQREVYLEGEAFFEVANAAEWPFVIHSAGGMKTTVLGTSFNIKAYPGRSQAIVSVVSGKVKVTRAQQELSTLEKGQEMRLQLETGVVTRRPASEVTIAAWQSGDIGFNDESLQDILKDLQVFYGTEIKLNNPGLANLLLTTGFQKNTSIESALEILCDLANAKYARTNNGFVVY